MIRKTLFLLALLFPIAALAQTTGSWKPYSIFTDVKKIFETPTKVYFVSEGSLFSYEPETSEFVTYTTSNYLNETNISDVYYNPLSDYIAIAYVSGNIDLLYNKTNKVVNLPDIKNAVVNISRTINDIDFAPGKMLVSTAFGLVVFDDKKHEVKESGIYNKNVASATYMGDNLLWGDGNTVYVLPAGKRINNIDNFTTLSVSQPVGKLRGISADKGIFSAKSGTTYPTYRITTDGSGVTIDKDVITSGFHEPLRNQNGLFFRTPNGTMLFINEENFNSPEFKKLDESINQSIVGFRTDLSKVWVGNKDGIAQYNISGSTSEQLTDYVKPIGLNFTKVGRLTAYPEGGVLASPYGSSTFFNGDWGNSSNQPSYLNKIESDGTIRDITPKKLSGNVSGRMGYLSDSRQPVIDPDDSSIIYVPSNYNGVYKIRDDQEVVLFNQENSTILNWNDTNLNVYVSAADIDGKGNLWVVQWYSNSRIPFLSILPAAGRKKEIPLKSDWKSYINTNLDGALDTDLIACKKSNLVIVNDWSNLNIIDTEGKLDLTDSNAVQTTTLYDQDNKAIDFNAFLPLTFMEDSKGRVWITSQNGLYVIENPSTFKNTLKVNRVKVPRNDGTNYADYLLEGETIHSIDEDSSGRMWVGTETSGVYLIDARDLSNVQVLANYTTKNSPLPNDNVWAVACDKASSEVYFGTTSGMIGYLSDASAAADDFSNVVAYPNPVRPDYMGWITIKGLMDDSIVTITDQASNQVFKGKSNGGMISWDGCDSRGQRVHTGVYYVFASSNSSGSNKGDLVTKILVVK